MTTKYQFLNISDKLWYKQFKYKSVTFFFFKKLADIKSFGCHTLIYIFATSRVQIERQLTQRDSNSSNTKSNSNTLNSNKLLFFYIWMTVFLKKHCNIIHIFSLKPSTSNFRNPLISLNYRKLEPSIFINCPWQSKKH